MAVAHNYNKSTAPPTEGVVVFRPGEQVVVKHGKGDFVVVQAACLRGGGFVEYEVSWWANGENKTAWLPAEELEPFYSDTRTVKIGFK